MSAGIPGTGVGGLFYVLVGLLAPLRGVNRRRAALYVAVLAIAVLAGIFATGWLLGWALGPPVKAPLIAGPVSFHHSETGNVVRWASVLASGALLGAVLLSVQIARLFQRKRPRR